MLGGLLISIFAGCLLGTTALMAGFGFWWSLLIYSAGGVCVFLIVAAFTVLRGASVAAPERDTASVDPHLVNGMRTARTPVLVPMQQTRRIVATEVRRVN